MNQNPFTMEAVAAIRYQERLVEAEQARLSRRLRAGQAGIARRVCATILIATGAKLTRMGQHLRPAQTPRLVPAIVKRR